MSLTLVQLKEFHDKAYNSGQVTRENAANDMVFYYITHWDDVTQAGSNLAYKGQFDIVRKAGRSIMADLVANEVQIDFDPEDGTPEKTGQLIDGMYTTDRNNNVSLESFMRAKNEAVVCGVGAWKLKNKYKTNRMGERNQVIAREPILEANNSVYWDPNAKLVDRSDADYVDILTAYSDDGYIKLVKDLTGETITAPDAESFKVPEQSYTFPWLGGEGSKIYVVEFYHREEIKDTVLFYEDPFGQTRTVLKSGIKEIEDELNDTGFELVNEKEIERYQITRYIASGLAILEEKVIAGDNIPVVPTYGEQAWVEGEPHYEGVVRLAKDPQRLRNFQGSYLADMASRSPRQKPIFFQEQLGPYAHMYDESGPDNNYPYLLQMMKGPNGEPLPIGPPGIMPEQKIPDAIMAGLAFSREAVEDVASSGIPQEMVNTDLSGKAALIFQARLDMQSMTYQENYRFALRRDAEIYKGMAQEIYDIPRSVKLTLPDGSKKTAQVMEQVYDEESGEFITINDLTNAEFDITAKIGASYTSQKEKTIENLKELLVGIDPGDPMRRFLQLKIMLLSDGVDTDDMRDYANKELILAGVKKPETDEEKQMVAAAQQKGQEPSAEMVLAQGELFKGQADLKDAETKLMQVQGNFQNEGMKRKIDFMEMQLKEMELKIKAQSIGADISNKQADTAGKSLDNAAKIIELKQPKELSMSDDDLFKQMMAG